MAKKYDWEAVREKDYEGVEESIVRDIVVDVSYKSYTNTLGRATISMNSNTKTSPGKHLKDWGLTSHENVKAIIVCFPFERRNLVIKFTNDEKEFRRIWNYCKGKEQIKMSYLKKNGFGSYGNFCGCLMDRREII